MSNESCTETERLRVQLKLFGGIMSSSIDWTTLAVGALIGVGCKNELKAAAKIAAGTAATLACACADAAADAANAVQAQADANGNGNGGNNGH